MKRTFLLVLVMSSLSLSASWEAFPLRSNGTIQLWLVAGPLPNTRQPDHGEGCVGFFKDYLTAFGGESQAVPTEGNTISLEDGRTIPWQTAFSSSTGLLDYISLFNMDRETPGVAYAFCQLVSDKAQSVAFKVRSDDGVRIWLNQTMVHDHHLGRGIDQGEDYVPVTLQKGNNPLLVKVDQGGGGWAMSLTVVGVAGEAVQGLTSSVALTSPLQGKIKSAKLTATPKVIQTAEGERQIIQANIICGSLKNVTCRMTASGWPKPQVIKLGDLTAGQHLLDLQVPPVTKSSFAQVTLQAKSDKLEIKDLQLAPAPKWTVYLVQHTHTDIGYTRPQTEILPEHLRYIDYALDYCDLTDDYPDDAKFRWTCEVSWTVREYLKRRPPAQIERLKKRIAEGRIELTGMFLNMSEIATEQSLAASLQPLRDFQQMGLPVQTAMQNDVNGAAWCLVDYFSDIGLKYLTMGINKTRSLLPFDKPTAFWWESPSGKRTLAFRPDHYHTGNSMQIHYGDMTRFEPNLLSYLQSLKEKGYPFDRIAVQFSGYHTDNSPPALKECDLVKAWNEKYLWPKLRLATAKEFLQYVEANHSTELPVYRVAWPDWWTDGFGSAARETAASRQMHVSMQVTEGLLSMAALLGAQMPGQIMERVAAVQDALLFYDEHTFGAAESISDPLAANSMIQWGEKSAYAWDAVKNAGMLREEALGLLQDFVPKAGAPTIAVFNTLNWPRSGLIEVFIDHEILPREKSFRIVDGQTGEAIPAQALRSRSEGTYWALWAKDVPPLGYKVYRILVVDQQREEPAKQSLESGLMENSYYRLQWDAQSGALTSLIDKDTNQELVDSQGAWTLGQLIYERLSSGRSFDRDAFTRTSVRNVWMQSFSKGPIWQSILFTADLDGCAEPNGVHGEIRLYETEKRIEFHFLARKLPVTDAEAMYVSFPFLLPDVKIVYEAQGGLVTPGENQLPGSSSDWQTVQNFISIRNEAGQIILGSDQIPLVQFGEINLGKWQEIAKIEKPHVFSWVMNNYWFTNFAASQQGAFEWSYYLTSTRDKSNQKATQFGWASRVPLVPRVLPAGKAGANSPSLSALKLDAANVVLVNAKPAMDGKGIILHLREVEGKETSVKLSASTLGEKIHALEEVNVLEQPLKKVGETISLLPFEVKFIRLTF